MRTRRGAPPERRLGRGDVWVRVCLGLCVDGGTVDLPAEFSNLSRAWTKAGMAQRKDCQSYLSRGTIRFAGRVCLLSRRARLGFLP